MADFGILGQPSLLGETVQYSAARRSKSRNKVAVGEPAAGSLFKVDSLRAIFKVDSLRAIDTLWSQCFTVPAQYCGLTGDSNSTYRWMSWLRDR